MSRDAGGLAQMTYSSLSSPSGLGVPAAGFASRGKGSQLKRLNLASAPKVASISENQTEPISTPRTSRSHLLAGLRTAPKTPTSNVPASAPYSQTNHRFSGMDSSRYSDRNDTSTGTMGQGLPRTAIGSTFPSSGYNQYGGNASQQYYTMPEQVLSPPPMQFDTQEDEGMDPNVLAQLVATELFLEQRRKQLQQQLLQLTAQGMQINATPLSTQPQQFSAPMGMSMNMYDQQMNGNMSIPQEVPGQPGMYIVYNQQTGQYQYVADQSMLQQSQQDVMQQPSTPGHSSSPPNCRTPFRSDSSSSNENGRSAFTQRTSTPPKKTPSPPQDVTPLPPPSANAFRRGHKKINSLGLSSSLSSEIDNGPKSALQRPVGLPATPMTGTFGPGQGRAGEHPVRQPRGPPPIEELKAAPTTKFENSKNFSSRQRRRAVNSLVRAGIERRGVRTETGSSGSPVSEPDLALSLSSDNESDSVIGSLSGKPSIGSLRAAANGAIGSELKERKKRERSEQGRGPKGSLERGWSVNSVSSDEGISVGGKLMEVCPEDLLAQGLPERQSTPILVLTNAEERKRAIF